MPDAQAIVIRNEAEALPDWCAAARVLGWNGTAASKLTTEWFLKVLEDRAAPSGPVPDGDVVARHVRACKPRSETLGSVELLYFYILEAETFVGDAGYSLEAYPSKQVAPVISAVVGKLPQAFKDGVHYRLSDNFRARETWASFREQIRAVQPLLADLERQHRHTEQSRGAT